MMSFPAWFLPCSPAGQAAVHITRSRKCCCKIGTLKVNYVFGRSGREIAISNIHWHVLAPIGVRNFAIDSLGIVDLDWTEIVIVAIDLMDFLNDDPNISVCSNTVNKLTAMDQICRRKHTVQ
jgi:hypothetical protein